MDLAPSSPRPPPPSSALVNLLQHDAGVGIWAGDLFLSRTVASAVSSDTGRDDPEMVRKAQASFAPTSGAGPSGLSPSHLQEALRHSSGVQTLRILSEVLQLLLRGEIPTDIRPWVCGASLMALREPNSSLRPIAVGETLRSLCSKVSVELMGSSVKCIIEAFEEDEVRMRSGGAFCETMDQNLLRRPRQSVGAH